MTCCKAALPSTASPPTISLHSAKKQGISTTFCSSHGQYSISSNGSHPTCRNALRARRRRRAPFHAYSQVPASSGRSVSASASPSDASGSSRGRFYFNITGFPFPLGPFLERRTICKEVDKERIWIFEQEQALGFSSVTTNVRMTVIKLKSGGLWVHAPIAPTKECIQVGLEDALSLGGWASLVG